MALPSSKVKLMGAATQWNENEASTPDVSIATPVRGARGAPSPKRPVSLAAVYDRRTNNFDALRFALAAVVLWSHTFPLSGRPMDPLFRLSRQIDGGSLAVEAFFIVSGFLVAQSWEVDPSALRFLLKRGLRIVPALLASLVFGALIVGPLASAQPVQSYFASGAPWWHFLGVVLNRHLAIPGTFPDNPLPAAMNYSLWSLRFDFGGYA